MYRPFAGFLAGSILVVAGACSDEGVVQPTSLEPVATARAHALIAELPPTCGAADFGLTAGRSLGVGEVTLASDDENLYVRVRTEGDWRIASTRLRVVDEPGFDPRPGRDLAPGLFEHGSDHGDPVPSVIHSAALPDEARPYLWVALYAEVVRGDETEAAWLTLEPRERGPLGGYVRFDLPECGGTVIGSDGGIVEGEGATLSVPGSALDDEVEITVERVADDDVPAGLLPGTVFDFGPDGLEFGEPAELTLDYDDTGLDASQEAALAIHLMQGDGSLLALPTAIDADANTATALVEHFSVYGVGAPPVRVEMTRGGVSYVNGTVQEGSAVRHLVLVRNIGSDPVPGDDVTVEFEAQLNSTPESIAYSSGSCTLNQPAALVYHFVCTLPNDVSPGTAGALAFSFTPPDGSAGETIEATASFAYDGWTGVAGPVETSVIEAPDEADVAVFIDELPTGSVGTPLEYTVHVVNQGPGPIDGAMLEIELTGDATLEVPGECTVDPTDAKRMSCPVGPLPSGFGEARTVTVVAGSPGFVTLTAHLLSVTGSTDPNPGNDVGVAETQVN